MHLWTAAETASRLQAREVSAREVAEAALDRIKETEPKLGSFLALDEEWTLSQADKAQTLLDTGCASPLTGVPIAIKDNICTKGVATTCASRILEGFVPPYSATVVQKLETQGVVMAGKTNLDEFAMGTSCENSAYQLSRNPWDQERSPGGSSGGSAAAVGGCQTPLSLGSDTGGSIRMPASLCGIVGFKPTYGRVSRWGLVAFGSSLDQIGPFGRTVEDAALLASAISGHCPLDSTSLPHPSINVTDLKSGSLRGLKLGVPKELFGSEVHPTVLESLSKAMDILKTEGVEFRQITLPSLKLGVTTYYIIAPSEASSNLARFDGIRYGPRIEEGGHNDSTAATRGRLFGHEVKLRIMVGTYALSAGYYDAYYHKAQQVRGLMSDEIDEALKDVDFLFSPTSPVTAFKLGELKDDQMALKLLDLCTIPANMGGFPAISIPCGMAGSLPVGMQLMGRVLGDEALLQAAFSCERALPGIGFAPIA